MVQTVKSFTLLQGRQKMIFEKPLVLRRIFFKIVALLQMNAGYRSYISFDDPSFNSFFIITGRDTSFEARGEGIFQGNIWLRNQSSVSILYTVTEILV